MSVSKNDIGASLFFSLTTNVTAFQIQRNLNTKVLDGYTDIFPKVCADSVRYCYNKIISLNKGICKKQYI